MVNYVKARARGPFLRYNFSFSFFLKKKAANIHTLWPEVFSGISLCKVIYSNDGQTKSNANTRYESLSLSIQNCRTFLKFEPTLRPLWLSYSNECLHWHWFWFWDCVGKIRRLCPCWLWRTSAIRKKIKKKINQMISKLWLTSAKYVAMEWSWYFRLALATK